MLRPRDMQCIKSNASSAQRQTNLHNNACMQSQQATPNNPHCIMKFCIERTVPKTLQQQCRKASKLMQPNKMQCIAKPCIRSTAAAGPAQHCRTKVRISEAERCRNTNRIGQCRSLSNASGKSASSATRSKILQHQHCRRIC